jgi:hypothetical protein
MPPRLESPRATAPASKPVVRGQNNDDPAPVRIPTPEELGLGPKKIVSGDEPLDWTLVERRLDSAGVTGYQMEKTADGYQFTCQLAAGPVSGRGSSKNEAVREALFQLAK